MWSVQYTDLFGKKMVESFHKEDAAISRYEELLPRTYGEFGDLDKVSVAKDEDGASAASLGACPTGVKSAKKVDENTSDLEAIYGDGGIYTGESSADGSYPKNSPMGTALVNNDVDTLKALHDGNVPVPDRPWRYLGWIEDIDAPEDANGNYPYVYDMDTDYDMLFVEDFHRIIGKPDNEEALGLLLEYYPDFIPTPVDFNNAIHKGYSKSLLNALFNNIRSIYSDEEFNINYGYDEYGDDPVKNLTEFLGE